MWIFLEKHFEEVLTGVLVMFMASMVFFQAEDGIRDLRMSRGLGDVYKRQAIVCMKT